MFAQKPFILWATSPARLLHSHSRALSNCAQRLGQHYVRSGMRGGQEVQITRPRGPILSWQYKQSQWGWRQERHFPQWYSHISKVSINNTSLRQPQINSVGCERTEGKEERWKTLHKNQWKSNQQKGSGDKHTQNICMSENVVVSPLLYILNRY